jgi:hypothetical protein
MSKHFATILIALLFFGIADSYSQSSSVAGIVIDAQTKEPIIGAYVIIPNLNIGGVTDIDGRYTIRNVPVGTHTIQVRYVGYNPVSVTGVTVAAGQRATLDVTLVTSSSELDEVTVVAFRQTSSIESVLIEVQRLNQVASGVSAQQIARSQDNNAAQVMRRVPGITINDNRFVMIRGLSERYNNVMINNVTAPSTEVDKRTFSFDLISSGSLDKMLIYKSGTPDLPGEFAGGVIKLFTVDDVPNNFFKVNFGLGYRVGTTGTAYFQTTGSTTDFLGFDGGYRRLPSSFPDSRTIQNSPRNAQLRIDAAHSLPNNFQPERNLAWADQSMGFTIGRSRSLGGERLLTSITTLNYATGYQNSKRQFNRYFEWEDKSNDILKRFAFTDDTYQKDNKINLMSNWKYRINRNHSITFKNLFNQIGENETHIRNGQDFIQRPDDDLRNYLLSYRSRSIYTGQLEGTHILDGANSVRWVAGGSYLREDEPDMRRFRTFRNRSSGESMFQMQTPPSSNLFDTGRYFGDLNEFSLNHSVDFTRDLRNRFGKIKTGYAVDLRDRGFNSRYLSYLYPGFFDPNVREELIRLPLDQIFARENLRTLNGFVLEEGTRPIDSYSAGTLTTAAYVSTEFITGRFNTIGGIRVEHNRMRMDSRDDFSVISVDNTTLAWLPFINTTYTLGDKTQLRLAYGRTVNRPEFRELAPFVFYDYKMDAGRVGNPNLSSATIHNLDARLEWYPRSGETFNIGVFFKQFDNPIENKTIIVTESPQFGYINADEATSYGVEIELRKSLMGMTTSSFLDRFSINANASLIHTEVDLGGLASAQEQVRPLQGQSPYIINAALYYEGTKHGLTGSLAYNIIGPRIYSVGDVLFPTIYEMPRHSVDLTLTQKMSKHTTVKLGVTDLLNAPYRFFQDSNRDGKADIKIDHPISSFNRGQLVNLSVSYDF